MVLVQQQGWTDLMRKLQPLQQQGFQGLLLLGSD